MTRRRGAPARSLPLSVDVDGKRYQGTYTVGDGVVEAHLPRVGTKATQVGGSEPEDIALMLLRELVAQAKKPR